MTIQSYLVYAEAGRADSVKQALHAIPGCDVTPALNGDVLVLVTESENDPAQKELETRIESIAGVSCLSMVGGWTC